MKTTSVAFANIDDPMVVWAADAVDDGCRGFAIERRLRRAGATETHWLGSYAPPPKTVSRLGQHQSSLDWPFRAFSWTDHSVGAGDAVSRTPKLASGSLNSRPALAHLSRLVRAVPSGLRRRPR